MPRAVNAKAGSRKPLASSGRPTDRPREIRHEVIGSHDSPVLEHRQFAGCLPTTAESHERRASTFPSLLDDPRVTTLAAP